MKKVFIRTLGCQMNVRDTEVVSGLLNNSGFRLTEDKKSADVIILNTCSVRQHAEDKVWSEIGSLARSKVKNKKSGVLIGLIGCMAQNYKEQVFTRAKEVDFVVGPSDIGKIPEIIQKLSANNKGLQGVKLQERKIWETEGDNRPEDIYHTGFYQKKNHVYVVISEGCSNYCSYCVVPYVRGELRNRNHQEILKEIEEAVEKGITTITLLGQNVNAYKYKDIDFVKLVGLVNLVKGLKEFSFVTSHPKDTSLGLFQAMADTEKLKKYLHLPVQSGSDRILKLMNRGYTRKFYLDLADKYRRIVKGAKLSTDIMVGFPSETEKDFADIYELVKKVEFDAAYIFKYSPRPHTQARDWADNVTRLEKEKRHKIILELQKEISRKKKC